MNLRSTIAALALLASVLPAAAATIEVRKSNSGVLSVVTVQGDFELGDEKTFQKKTQKLPGNGTLVLLNSDGGNLYAGLVSVKLSANVVFGRQCGRKTNVFLPVPSLGWAAPNVTVIQLPKSDFMPHLTRTPMK
jgi:hypothetical protein